MPFRCMPLYTSALAFIYVVLREVPITSSILDNFVMRLKRALDFVGVENFTRHFSPEYLLWLLFLGSWIAQGREDWHWYHSKLVWLIGRFGFRHWDQIKGILAEYCFVASVCENPYQELFKSIRQGSRLGVDPL